MSNDTEENIIDKKYCKECNTFHYNISFCENCGTCLYKNSTQVDDEKYPLFKCTKCNKINFWD